MELEFNQVGHKNSCIENWHKWLALQSVGRLATTLVATISDNIYLFFLLPSSASQSPAGGWDSLILTTVEIHPTTYTLHSARNSSFACLEPYYHNCGDLFLTHLQLIHNLFMTSLYFVHDFFITCSLLVHDFFLTCSLLVHYLFTTCSHFVELFMSC